MPVRFDGYDRNARAVDWRPTPGSNAARTLRLLIEHPEAGFTPSEIAEETGVTSGSVGPTLQRLLERGLVRHREPNWAAADDDHFAAYGGMLHGLAAVEDDGDGADVDASGHTVPGDDLATWRRERAEGEG